MLVKSMSYMELRANSGQTEEEKLKLRVEYGVCAAFEFKTMEKNVDGETKWM